MGWITKRVYIRIGRKNLNFGISSCYLHGVLLPIRGSHTPNLMTLGTTAIELNCLKDLLSNYISWEAKSHQITKISPLYYNLYPIIMLKKWAYFFDWGTFSLETLLVVFLLACGIISLHTKSTPIKKLSPLF